MKNKRLFAEGPPLTTKAPYKEREEKGTLTGGSVRSTLAGGD